VRDPASGPVTPRRTGETTRAPCRRGLAVVSRQSLVPLLRQPRPHATPCWSPAETVPHD
jgi:hypothetical protein